MTSDDLFWAVACRRSGTDPGDGLARAAFYARPQACLRASPLVRSHGCGLHHDAQGRVALVDSAGPDHAALLAEVGVQKRPGMRKTRG
jgi:hypothetical protein